MIVLKFGGTSVGTPESLVNVKKIVLSLDKEAIVVVSALGGLTDRLIATANLAAAGNAQYRKEWQAMADRHLNIIDAVIDSDEKRQHALDTVNPLLNELRRLYDGISLIEYLPAQTLDRIVSLGERMSSVIVADMIPGASHANSLDIIKTEKWFDKNIASTNLTTELIREHLANQPKPVVMGGFISTDKDSGRITNLGRGGSDYTAALVAAALDAEELQIWTDVDGFMTCDPRIVADARVINEMSFVESMDLCTFGAKVIYPPTIYPVFHKNIPIRILNTHNPSAPGTQITDHTRQGAPGRHAIPAENSERATITGLSALKGQSLITLRGRMAYDTAEISSRSLNALAKKGISPHQQNNAGLHNTFSLAVASADTETALALLRDEFAPELNNRELEEISAIENLAILAAVGDNISKIPSISVRIIDILEKNNIILHAYSDKASETALTFVINEEQVPAALQALHSQLSLNSKL